MAETTTLRIPILLTLTPEALQRAKDTAADVIERGAKRLGHDDIQLSDEQRDLLLRAFLASQAAVLVDPMCAQVIGAVMTGQAQMPPPGQSYAVRFDPEHLPGLTMILPLTAFDTTPQPIVDGILTASENDALAQRH